MKLFHVISTSILGTAMAIGVGLAVANHQKAERAEAAAYTYVKVSSLSAGKDVLIVTHCTSGDHNGQYYIVDATTAATSSGPKAIPISLTNSQIVGDYDDHLFTVAASSSNWTFKTGTKYLRLGAPTNNNGARIDTTNQYREWAYSAGVLSNEGNGTTRYFGVYSHTDWRTYNSSTAGNYSGSGQNVEFYEKSGSVETYTVTYTAGENGTGTFAHADQPKGNYSLLAFDSLTGISTNSFYRFKDYTVGGVKKNPGDTITISGATSITVNFEEQPLESTFDFTKNWSTYASDWEGYAPHVVTGNDVGALYNGTVSFTYTSKQSGTIADRPVVAAKSGIVSTMTFLLDSTVSESYNITSVSVSFKQWSSSKRVAASLYKGTAATGTVLDSFAQTDTPKNLETTNLNGDSFIVDFTTTESSNQQLGVSSILIGLAHKAAFGTLDHIKITSLPNCSIYHVDEYFDPTGLQVTAYDGANEETASYKDVTNHIDTLIDNSYQFVNGDVPGFDVEVEYTESTITKSTSYHIDVYAKAEYELVTSEPTDWSGNYLLVASYTDGELVSHTVAINSALVNFDQPLNFKEVTVSSNTITTGQECEFVFAKYNSGYSMQGKNGKYAYGNSNNRFMTSETAQQLTLDFESSNFVTLTGASGSTDNYIMSFNTSNAGAERFGFYKNATSNIKFYKLKASADANAYAQLFLETLSTGSSAVCHYDPDTHIVSTDLDELRIAWELLAEEYDTSLSASDKEQFRLGVASEDPSASNIAKALALYDHIVTAYGEQLKSGEFTNYNFMNRSYGLQPGQVSIASHLSNNTIIIIVIITSVVTLTAVGCFFIIRRKKHN